MSDTPADWEIDDDDHGADEFNLAGACELAREIFERHDARFVVLAVGRFLPPDSITPISPWAVSVHDWTTGRKSVIRTRTEWESMIDPASHPSKRATQHADRASPPADRATDTADPVGVPSQQPSLF